MQRVVSEFEFIGGDKMKEDNRTEEPLVEPPSTTKKKSAVLRPVLPKDMTPAFARCSYRTEFPRYKYPPEEGRSEEFVRVRQELYDTERDYLQYLKTLIEVFIEPLAANPRFTPFIDSHRLIADLHSIISVNKEILRSLRESPSIHSAFASMTPFLKLYSSYASNYGHTQEALIELVNSARFRAFVEKQEAETKAFGNKFAALLVMPIQRIPRYTMLLKRLSQATDDSIEKAALSEVLEELEDITESMQKCIADYENREKLLEIHDKITIPGGILIPGRRFVHEGTLFHRVNVGEAIYRERMFWLFSDILVVGKAKPSVFPAGRKYDMKFRFPLRHLIVKYDQWDGSLQLKCKGESLIVTSDTFEKLGRWHNLLETAVDRACVMRATLRKESSRLPMKNKKTNIRKAITKRFHQMANMTYHYGVSVSDGDSSGSNEPSTSTSLPLQQSPFRPDRVLITEAEEHAEESFMTEEADGEGTSGDAGNRKRRTMTEFDRELQAVVRTRYVEHNEDGSPSTFTLNPLTPVAPAFVKHRRPLRETAAAIAYSSPSKRQKVHRTLTQPEIRKLSYLEHVSSAESSEHSAENSPINRRASVPWWVSETAPAEYVRGAEVSRLTKIAQRCSIM